MGQAKAKAEAALEAQTWLEANTRSVVVTLRRAIPVSGENTLTLRIREPLLDDLLSIPAEAFTKPMSILAHVLATCAGVPPSSVRLLGAPDLVACAEALAGLGFIPTDAYALLGSEQPSDATGSTGSD